MPQYHPEYDPDGFKKLRNAYEQAIEFAKQEQDELENEKQVDEVTLILLKWKQKVELLYCNIYKRQDVEQWKEALKDDACFYIDTAEKATWILFQFLMIHHRLPKKIYEILNEKYKILDNEKKFSENTSPQFFKYVKSILEDENIIDFPMQWFHGGEDANYDLFMEKIEELQGYIEREEFEIAQKCILEIQKLEIGHPYLEILKGELQYKLGNIKIAYEIFTNISNEYVNDKVYFYLILCEQRYRNDLEALKLCLSVMRKFTNQNEILNLTKNVAQNYVNQFEQKILERKEKHNIQTKSEFFAYFQTNEEEMKWFFIALGYLEEHVIQNFHKDFWGFLEKLNENDENRILLINILIQKKQYNLCSDIIKRFLEEIEHRDLSITNNQLLLNDVYCKSMKLEFARIQNDRKKPQKANYEKLKKCIEDRNDKTLPKTYVDQRYIKELTYVIENRFLMKTNLIEKQNIILKMINELNKKKENDLGKHDMQLIMANAYYEMGFYDKALSICIKIAGEEFDNKEIKIQVLVLLQKIYYFFEKYEESIRCFQEFMKMNESINYCGFEQNIQEHNTEKMMSLYYAIKAYFKLKEWKEIDECYQKMQIYEKDRSSYTQSYKLVNKKAHPLFIILHLEKLLLNSNFSEEFSIIDGYDVTSKEALRMLLLWRDYLWKLLPDIMKHYMIYERECVAEILRLASLFEIELKKFGKHSVDMEQDFAIMASTIQMDCETFYYCAKILFQKHKYEESVCYLYLLQNRYPMYQATYLLLAKVLVKLESEMEASQYLEKLFAINPYYKDVKRQLTQIYYLLYGKTAQICYLKKAIQYGMLDLQDNPQCGEAWLNQCKNYEMLGDYLSMEKCALKAKFILGDSYEIDLLLGKVYFALEYYEKALFFLELGMEKSKGDQEVYEVYILTLGKAGKVEELYKEMLKNKKRRFHDQKIYITFIKAFISIGYFDAIRTIFEDVLSYGVFSYLDQKYLSFVNEYLDKKNYFNVIKQIIEAKSKLKDRRWGDIFYQEIGDRFTYGLGNVRKGIKYKEIAFQRIIDCKTEQKNDFWNGTKEIISKENPYLGEEDKIIELMVLNYFACNYQKVKYYAEKFVQNLSIMYGTDNFDEVSEWYTDNKNYVIQRQKRVLYYYICTNNMEKAICYYEKIRESKKCGNCSYGGECYERYEAIAMYLEKIGNVKEAVNLYKKVCKIDDRYNLSRLRLRVLKKNKLQVVV